MINERAHSKCHKFGDSIVDLHLRGEFDSISLHKALGNCVNQTGGNRPSMKRVTLELNDCLALLERFVGGPTLAVSTTAYERFMSRY